MYCRSVKNTLLLLIFLSLLGCVQKNPSLLIGEKPLNVEIVSTDETRTKGLMFRSTLPDGQGMLFIYPSTQRLSFWMKNTILPLTIAFIDDSHKIISIQDMDPQSSPPFKLYISPKPVRFALEVPQGWFNRQGIALGAKVEFSKAIESAIRKAE